MNTTEPLTFTPGNFYRTRDGRKARIYATDCEIHGAINEIENHWEAIQWMKSGKHRHCENLDLIAPWIDRPEVNWSALAAWHRWVAMDENGEWFSYVLKPVRIISKMWSTDPEGNDDEFFQIRATYAPKFSGDWKDSLVERPQILPLTNPSSPV